jgi:hypothetical protein
VTSSAVRTGTLPAWSAAALNAAQERVDVAVRVAGQVASAAFASVSAASLVSQRDSKVLATKRFSGSTCCRQREEPAPIVCG